MFNKVLLRIGLSMCPKHKTNFDYVLNEIVSQELHRDKGRFMPMHSDNGYVDSHVDYNDSYGCDYHDSHSSGNNNSSNNSNGGCLGEFFKSFFIVMAIIFGIAFACS